MTSAWSTWITAVALAATGCAHAAPQLPRGNPEPPTLLSNLYRLQEPDQWAQFESGGGDATATDRAPLDLDGVTEIALQRTGCYGACPAYQVTVRVDGVVEYWGGDFAPRQGRHSGQAGTSLSYLATLARELGLYEMKSYYSRPVSDNPTTFVSIVRNGKRTLIMDYGAAGPLRLIAFQEMVDRVLERVEWTPESATR